MTCIIYFASFNYRRTYSILDIILNFIRKYKFNNIVQSRVQNIISLCQFKQLVKFVS